MTDDEAFELLLKEYDASAESGASGVERLRMACRMIEAYPRQVAANLMAHSMPDEERVERVAVAIERTMFASHEFPLDAELHEKYRVTAWVAIQAMRGR